jgi:hypothetical protein
MEAWARLNPSLLVVEHTLEKTRPVLELAAPFAPCRKYELYLVLFVDDVQLLARTGRAVAVGEGEAEVEEAVWVDAGDAELAVAGGGGLRSVNEYIRLFRCLTWKRGMEHT